MSNIEIKSNGISEDIKTGEPTGEVISEKEPEKPKPTKKIIKREIVVFTEFEGNKYTMRTVPLIDGWKTELIMNDRQFNSIQHRCPISKKEWERDIKFARRINIEHGCKCGKEKYLKPIYDMIAVAESRKNELDVAVQELEKSIITSQEEEEAEEKLEVQKAEAERIKKKNEYTIKKNKLFEILGDKSDNATIDQIMAARRELREIMMSEFWSVEGSYLNSGDPGHLVLQKLPIADYISKVFNIVTFGGRHWYYDWQKAFYTYDPDDETIQKEIGDIMRMVGDGDFYKYNGNAGSDITNIIILASTVRVYTENPFNKAKNVINARNGVLELDYEKGEVKLIGKKPDYMFSYCINTIYDETASSAEIDMALDQVVEPAQRELIYQIAALAIRDTDPELDPSKVAYIFYGKPHTGKNTVQNLLLRFFGGRVVSHIPLHEIIENKYVKPLLEGKLLNLDDELPSALYKAESREIKSLTGGKKHTLEPKNVKPYEGIITALLVFAGNQFPKCYIKKSENGFWGRWEIIYFEHDFDVNEKFGNSLFTDKNMSGFFNKVIKKLFEIRGHEIIRNVRIVNVFDEWMKSSSNVYRFIQEETVETDIPVDHQKDGLYSRYSEWCNFSEIPIEDRVSKQNFGKELVGLCGAKVVHIGTGSHAYVYRMFRQYEREQSSSSTKQDYGSDGYHDIESSNSISEQVEKMTEEQLKKWWDSPN